MNRFVLILIAACMLAGCRMYDIDEVLLQRHDVSLTFKGKTQMAFDPKTCQMGYNEEKGEFRLYEDRLSGWFTVKCSARPAHEGQELKADVSWTTASSTKSYKGLFFEVKKTSPDGHVWLWNDSMGIGAVIRIL